MSLATRYLGLQLAHPIVAAASPLTATLDGMRRLEDAGAAAVVMASLYEEQIRAEDTAYALYTEHGSNSQPEAGSYFPELPDYDSGVSGHLETLQRASEALEIPVIASLNGTTAEGWVGHARALEQAGAAAIELNVYSIPVDLAVSGAEVERQYLEIVRQVRSSVRIPVSVKLAPYFTSLPHMAAELVRAGADGLVLFNRYYAPDIDLLTLRVTRSLPLSTAAELPLSLVWIALLSRRLGGAHWRPAVASRRMSKSSNTCSWARMWSRQPRPCCGGGRSTSRRCARDSNAGSAKTGSTPSTRFAASRTRPTLSTSIPCSARSTWRPSPITSPASSSSKRYLGGEGVPGWILSSSSRPTSRPPRRSCRQRDSGGGYRRCCTGSARGTGPSRTHV